MADLILPLEIWFTLWGIVLGFLVQVVYDWIGENSHGIPKYSLGLLLSAIFAFALVVSAYFLGYLSSFGDWNTLGILIAPSAAIVATITFGLIQRKKTNGVKKDNEKREWKITIKNGDKMLEATGMDGDTVQKILQSWNANINPVKPEEPKKS